MIGRMMMSALVAGACLWPVNAGAEAMAAVTIRDLGGKTVGTAMLRGTPNGTLIAIRFRGLPPGEHAFHVHAVGKCEPPFKSAGGHYNPTGAKHGIMVAGGPHAGDMPNIHVGANGRLDIEVLNTHLKLDGRLFNANGAAIVLHAKGDDYRGQPSGAAGPRIACGVIEKK